MILNKAFLWLRKRGIVHGVKIGYSFKSYGSSRHLMCIPLDIARTLMIGMGIRHRCMLTELTNIVYFLRNIFVSDSRKLS